jgi:phosphoglycolate phosphatase-like HAD superfamily hydrolase
MSEQAPHLHLLAVMAEAEAQREAQRLEEVRELHARFEAYYQRRERSADAWEQPTEPIDSVAVALEAAWRADAVEPRRRQHPA